MAPVSQQNTTGWPVLIFHVDPLALAWGEDGEPYLLYCTVTFYHPIRLMSIGKRKNLHGGRPDPVCRPKRFT